MSQGTPRTWFAGKSAPEDQDKIPAAFIAAAFFTLACPLGAVVWGMGYYAFSVFRMSLKTITGITATYATIFVVAGGFDSGWRHRYATPVRELVDAAKGGDIGPTIGTRLTDWVWLQLPLSVLAGAVAASVFCGWKWLRRPVWETHDRRAGPLDRLRIKRVTAAIENDTNGPNDGVTIGIDKYGHRMVQRDVEVAAHNIVFGASGSGKTTTMLSGIRDTIRRGHGLVFVDLKGAHDVPERLELWAGRYDRPFLHWSITDPTVGYHGPAAGPAYYDPIHRGDPSRKKDLLIASQKWDVEYYKSVNENYLQMAFQIAAYIPNPDVDSFADLADLLSIPKLQGRARALFQVAPKTEEGNRVLALHGDSVEWWLYTDQVMDQHVRETLSRAANSLFHLEESERSAVRNLASRISTMSGSTAGHWLKRDPSGHGRDIDLYDIAASGAVVVFSLDSSQYSETSAQIGGLLIQDLNTLSSELRRKPVDHPFHVFVDEFSALGRDNILALLSRARDARMPVTLSTQALGDLREIDPSFLDRALGTVNSFLLHRANTAADAEVFAGLTGMQTSYMKRYGVEMTSGMPGGMATGAATGQGLIEEIEDHVVKPSAFQAMTKGEVIYVAKSPETRVEMIRVIPESMATLTFPEHTDSPDGPTSEGDQGRFAPVALSDVPAFAKPESIAPDFAAVPDLSTVPRARTPTPPPPTPPPTAAPPEPSSPAFAVPNDVAWDGATFDLAERSVSHVTLPTRPTKQWRLPPESELTPPKPPATDSNADEEDTPLSPRPAGTVFNPAEWS